MKITFLGTGGGRFATILQERATGGIYLQEDKNIHIDPGPGALVKAYEYVIDPKKTDVILISHCHPDHYNDAEILIEALTKGGRFRNGVLAGSKSAIFGTSRYDSAISRYHKSCLENFIVMNPMDVIKVGNMKIEATPSFHSDFTTVGFKIYGKDAIVSYIADTAFEDELIEAHKDARVLIVCLTRPLKARIPYHLATEDVRILISGIKPELTLLTHMGMNLLRDDPLVQQFWLEKRTGRSVIAATDGMIVNVGEKIKIA